MKSLTPFALLLAAVVWTGCDASPTGAEDTEEAQFILVEDLDATAASNDYTFFDLDGNTAVADSGSSEWDLGFRSTSVIVNSGESGPGSANGLLYEGIFDDMTAVPGGVTLKSGSETPFRLAEVDEGEDDGWYHYSGPPAHLITPVPGRILLVGTSDGRYAKVRILSYYQGNPAEPGTSDARFYTFEYVLSAEGSAAFE